MLFAADTMLSQLSPDMDVVILWLSVHSIKWSTPIAVVVWQLLHLLGLPGSFHNISKRQSLASFFPSLPRAYQALGLQSSCIMSCWRKRVSCLRSSECIALVKMIESLIVHFLGWPASLIVPSALFLCICVWVYISDRTSCSSKIGWSVHNAKQLLLFRKVLDLILTIALMWSSGWELLLCAKRAVSSKCLLSTPTMPVMVSIVALDVFVLTPIIAQRQRCSYPSGDMGLATRQDTCFMLKGQALSHPVQCLKPNMVLYLLYYCSLDYVTVLQVSLLSIL